MEPFIHPHAVGKKLGVIPYQRTGTELEVARAAAPTPAQAPYDDPAFFTQPVLMQGFQPECGGFSLAFALAYLLSQQVALSGSFSYAFEKTVDGVPTEAGTTIKAIAECGQDAGSCLDSLFHDDGTDPQDVPPTLYQEATPQAIADAITRAGFVPLFLTDLSWNGLQAAVAKYKAVIVEAKVGAEWYTAPNGETSWTAANILPIRPPQSVIDAHFFVLGGKTTETETWFANSWSASWGFNGFGYLAENYMPFVQNAIVLYKMPPSVQAVVNHPTLTEQEKVSLIQIIINDIERALGLISKEVGQA